MAGRKQTLMTEDVLKIIEELPEPVFTAKEVSECVETSDPTVHARLRELEDAGAISSKKVGSRAVAWWRNGAF